MTLMRLHILFHVLTLGSQCRFGNRVQSVKEIHQVIIMMFLPEPKWTQSFWGNLLTVHPQYSLG